MMDSKVYKMQFIEEKPNEIIKDDVIGLLKIRPDHVGTTSGNYWVEAYGGGMNGVKALFKSIDFDEVDGANMEMIYSEFANLILDNTRVPKITLLEEYKGYLSMLSHRVSDRDTEDMEHIDSYIYYKYERNEQRHFYSMGIEDILECVRMGIDNYENYKIIEKEMVSVVLLDSLVNNADRHGKNWALVRGKNTNWYELAIFDHVKSFININSHRVGYSSNMLWSRVYVGPSTSSRNITGDKTVSFIKKQFPDYYMEFIEKVKKNKEKFYELIEGTKGIDTKQVKNILDEKVMLMEHGISLER